jgi:hypothetical protein
MIQRLRPHEVLAQLDGVRTPPGEIVREPLDRAERALRAAQEDRVGDVGAQRPWIAGEVTRAEQIADVRDDPVGARVDEQVVIERVDRLLDRVERVLDRLQVRLELAVLLDVLDLVDRGLHANKRAVRVPSHRREQTTRWRARAAESNGVAARSVTKPSNLDRRERA